MARVYNLDAEIEKIKSVMDKLSEKLKKYKETFNDLLGIRKLERNGIFTAVKVNPLEMGRKRSRVSLYLKNSRRKNSREKTRRKYLKCLLEGKIPEEK